MEAHFLSIFSQPGCQAATICAALNDNNQLYHQYSHKDTPDLAWLSDKIKWIFYPTLHISYRTSNIEWCAWVWDNVGTWHLQEVDPLNSGEEENENKDWHFFFHQVTFSLDSVPSFHFFISGSFFVTDKVIFKQQGGEPEKELPFIQPLLVHRPSLLA